MTTTKKEILKRIKKLEARGASLSLEETTHLLTLVSTLFFDLALRSGAQKKNVDALRTKFRDAGRRSPPWRPTSSRVPGRPQDGSDGNRINRWLLDPQSKFYADQKTATLVEIRYYLQALSMKGAPKVPALRGRFKWLIPHRVKPGAYKDPVQLAAINFHEILVQPSMIQSGHLKPLDRGGKHEPKNAFLMLRQSNQLQGNLRLKELLNLIKLILRRHAKKRKTNKGRR